MRVVIGGPSPSPCSAEVARPAHALWRQRQISDFEQVDALVDAIRMGQDTAKAQAEDAKLLRPWK